MKKIFSVLLFLIFSVISYSQSIGTAPYYISPIDSMVKIPATINGTLRNVYPFDLGKPYFPTIQRFLDSMAAVNSRIGAGGISYTFNNSSIKSTANNITLVNDSTSLTGNKVYGSNGGTKGWQPAQVIDLTGVTDGAILKYDAASGNIIVKPPLSLTTIGSSGAATYDNATGVLNIPQYTGGSGSYTLPIASSTTLGGIMVGTGLSINASTGELSATGGSSEATYYPTADATNTTTTGSAISGVNITIAAGQRYAIDGMISFGESSTGGMDIGLNSTTALGAVDILFFGRTSGTTTFNGNKINVATGTVATSTTMGTIASTNNWATVKGVIVGGAADATLTILYASHVAGQTTTLFKNGTYFKVTKL